MKNFHKLKKILVIGGSTDNVLICKLLKENNLEIILIDVNPNCPARAYSDHYENISTYKFNEQIQLIDKYNIDYCVTRCNGIPARNTFHLNEIIVNGKKSNIAENLLNKFHLSKFCKEKNIKYPKTLMAEKNIKDLEMTFPIILKPIYEKEGKITTFKISDSAQIDNHINKSNANSSVNQSIFQEYLEGNDFSLIGYVDKSKYYELGFFKEKNNFNEIELEHSGFETAKINLKKDFLEIAQKISACIKIPLSPLNIGFKVCAHETFLLECNLDFGGEKVLEKLVSSSNEELLNNYFEKLEQMK